MSTPAKNDYKYLKFISYLQIIGIILVVLGHSFHEYPDGAMGKTLWFYRLLYNVRMPMFTFVSGFLMYFTSFVVGRQQRSWAEFTKTKIKRLLIPYLVLTLVTFVPRASMSGMADDAIDMSLGGFLHSLVYADSMVIPYFWFLHMSFILLVGVYAVLWLAGKNELSRGIAVWTLVALFILLPLSDIGFSSLFAINEVVRLGVYFMLGVVYCRYSSVIDKYLHTSSILTAIVSAAIWIPMFFAFEGEDLARIASLFGILSFVTLTHVLENKHIGVLDHLRGSNYIIFLLSWYVNVATQQVLAHFVTLPWWVHTLLSLLGGIYIPWLGYKYLVKHPDSRWVRVTALLLGQNLKKR